MPVPNGLDASLALLLLVMLAKEAGVPIPIPSDLLMIVAGAQAATGAYPLVALALVILIAALVGASAQFVAVRAAGVPLVERLAPRLGLDPRALERVAERLRRRGRVGLFLALNVPGARAGAIVAAALARLRYADFVVGLVGGSGLFYAWHVALGYVAGPAAIALLGGATVAILALVVLAALGLVAWYALGRRGSLRRFAEASCPACLAATTLERRSAERSGVLGV